MTESLTEQRQQELLKFSHLIGVTFKDIKLLNTALTHTSYANEKERQIPDNEKLEFLGDAVLELASSTYLYKNFTELSEGELTKTRASIVCQDTLSKLARSLDLGNLILLGHGEAASGGRERDSTLEDAFEAVIGSFDNLHLNLKVPEMVATDATTKRFYRKLYNRILRVKSLTLRLVSKVPTIIAFMNMQSI